MVYYFNMIESHHYPQKENAMYRCDSHIHTHLSFDGDPTATVDAVCRAAIARGLDEITVTDHCDINNQVVGVNFYDRERGRAEVFAAKERYAGRLIVNWGVELGQANQFPAAAAAMLDGGEYDFVLGSLHNLTARDDFSCMDFKAVPDGELHALFAQAIEEAGQVIRFPGVQALAHLTYPLRYYARAGREFDLTPHLGAIEALFAEMRARGIDLEVNYSTLRTGAGFAMPDADVLALWVATGGDRVTLGSDAHRPDDVAGGFELALALLSRVGIKKTVTYRAGVPHEHTLFA